MLSGEFVVKAIFTFVHQQFICFVMEYMMGGDFAHILHDYGCLDDEVAKFYIAEIVLALEYLHGLGIIHRDLKPDNILLDRQGHIKLTDFGLSETGVQQKLIQVNAGGVEEPTSIESIIETLPEVGIERNIVYNDKYKSLTKLDGETSITKLDKGKSSLNKLDKGGSLTKLDQNIPGQNESKERSSSRIKESIFNDGDGGDELDKKKIKKGLNRLVGTPDYMAPEIIKGISISHKSLDWWSLGVMTFEFLTGFPPFNDNTAEKIYDNILNLRIPWDQLPEGWESMISAEAVDIIKKLLTLDHEKRLGANSVNEIKKHPWFQGIDWINIRKKEAPILPELEIDCPDSKASIDNEEIEPFLDQRENKDLLSEEVKEIMKHLHKEEAFKFETNRFDILDEDNQRAAEEMKELMRREIEEKLKKYKLNVGYQEESDESDSSSIDFKLSSNLTKIKAGASTHDESKGSSPRKLKSQKGL